MATPIHESQRKRNKKTPSKFYGFHSFAEAGFPVSLNGAFRDNIRQFLLQCAEPEDYELDGMTIWCTLLVYESRGTVLPLYTVEENVKHSVRPFCDYCRSAGWSHHFVSKRKYHLIIPRNEEWSNPLDEGAFDLQTHLLHGLIHSNGYGHLIGINGIEGGSKFICGREMMDLWDRICTALHARQISVEDLSSKRKMDLRLLHGVAYGHSWFSRWGYRFCHGSFGVREHNYETAMDILSSLDLDQVIDDFSVTNGCMLIKKMIHHYRTISDNNLVTIRDLFRFMLTLNTIPPTGRYSTTSTTQSSKCPGKEVVFSTPIKRCSFKFSTRLAVRNCPAGKEKSAKCRKFSNLAANLDSRWPVRRLEHVAEVIVEALKEKRAKYKASSSGMTRQEARDAARLHIGDTGLIDHVLKVMNNVIVGNVIVRRAVNRCTKILEYTIQDFKGSSKESFRTKVPGTIQTLAVSPGRSVYDDVTYLYSNVLFGYPESDSVSLAVQMFLHSKHFVKEWPFRDEDDDSLRFACRLITTSSIDLNDDVSRGFPPREFIIVPLYATLGDLKMAVQNAMRDTYCATEKLIVTEIIGMEGVQDEEVLFGLIESGQEIWARGCGLDLESDLRYQGGTENWTVRCKCGAQDDDGERMVACDICETWQHTRCSGIEDAEVVPRLFVCESCCSSLAPVQTHYAFMYNCDSYETSMLLPEGDMGLLH
ncbi:phd finger protein male meiocyte death 1 [Phtheirospermum japonicum]|uniref:Phd finger protein male meiocyte death 1 n=1 Tax=Phtheirospermum japonicum TaxID=374723 RepID=A0A830DA81_9LAMI|nr:phd finger protein male meiocyte death 1 [Phtheirospermum japonicum]